MREKLQSDSGETLVEVLASIVIASLSVALLFGCVMASSNMDREAEKLDKEHYAALTEAETQTGIELGKAELEIKNPQNSTFVFPEIKVGIYGKADAGMYSYKRTSP